MIYIYDILLNFNDSKRLVDFYEWDRKDNLEHIKKIPLFRISSVDMENIITSNIKVNKSFLDKICNMTLVYKNKRGIKYAALFCDLNKALAVEFNKDGTVICKSSLLLDEEEDVLEDAAIIDLFDFNYKVIEKHDIDPFLTRSEMFKKRYLLKEIESLFNDKYYDKFNYLYEEIFGRDDKNIKDRYQIIIDDINKNYRDEYNNLYEIVRLSYQKNRLH